MKYVVQGIERYHYKLSLVKSPPYVVYYEGNFDVLDKPLLAIVGPRLKSDYADQVLSNLFAILQRYDIVTISGLADGVDWLVHNLSIQYGIPTIAVIGE